MYGFKIYTCLYWDIKAPSHPDSLFRNNQPELERDFWKMTWENYQKTMSTAFIVTEEQITP